MKLDKKTIFYALILLFAIYFGYKCPFDYIFGISCAGCGMTRAFFSLLRLDFERAFFYHPLYGVVILVVLYFFLEKVGWIQLDKKRKDIAMWCMGFLFIITYFVRLLSGSEIVRIHFEDSLIKKIWGLVNNLI